MSVPGTSKPRRSWVTRDAFTTGRHKNSFHVPTYKLVPDAVEDATLDEEFDFSAVDDPHNQGTLRSAKGKEKEQIVPPEAHARSTKRRKLTHDLSFLEPSLPATSSPSSSIPPSVFPVPSSDLLKYIHHFACNYYSDRGQLFNESRTWRIRQKQAKLAAKRATDDTQSDKEDGPLSEAEGEVRETAPRRDMYKTMDGSALLAIGMLLQEHIGQLLTPKIPDGWEQDALDGLDDETEGENQKDGETNNTESIDAAKSGSEIDSQAGDEDEEPSDQESAATG
ncbi:hypothetical protein R3P38DRAFT_2930205 [Favolaschia claudopus]|uniref:Uncharacterized protein n=1 Tax=Favolaschia claudopus TaxID=2862362 RepID=A0AAW0BV42_9AGAR